MSHIANEEILKDFVKETKGLIAQMQETLLDAEADITLAQSLESYGQMVDRIMGGARIIAVDMQDKNHLIHKLADYTGICKAVGYKTSQIKDNHEFYQICVALLMDATDLLEEMMNEIEKGSPSLSLKEIISQTLIDRLRWVSEKFSSEYRESVEIKSDSKVTKLSQDEIDKLMSKLGL